MTVELPLFVLSANTAEQPFIDAVLGAGWRLAEPPFAPRDLTVPAGTYLEVGPEVGMRVQTASTRIENGVILDDHGYVAEAPPGWWENIRKLENKVIMVIGADIDLTESTDVLAEVNAAASRGHVAWTAANVRPYT